VQQERSVRRSPSQAGSAALFAGREVARGPAAKNSAAGAAETPGEGYETVRWFTAVLLLVLAGASPLWGDAVVAKTALPPESALRGAELVRNGDLETMGGDGLAWWSAWRKGYQVDRTVRHGGAVSARCRNDAPGEESGLSQTIQLDQAVPLPVMAEAWSKAEGVSGAADNGYSIWADVEYFDGDHLWGQAAAFGVGDHGWQKRTLAIIPGKPIRSVSIYGLFRGHTGVVWFDDFSVRQVEVSPGAATFDRQLVFTVPSEEVQTMPGPTLKTDDGFVLHFDASRGDIRTTAPGGIFLRDFAAGSDFRQARGVLTENEDGSITRAADDEQLKLRLTATYRSVGNAIRVDGEVQDLTGSDRAISVYFLYPVDAVGWRWHDDQRTFRVIEAGKKYDNFVPAGAGANDLASRYPLACISGKDEAIAIGAPLDVPRLCRFGYDAESRELYAAVDLGLAPDTENFPSRASFSLVLFRCDPEWGFRSALQRYYDLFPQCFTKRNKKEGIWMPFTDISTVEGFEDFGFQFKEGNNNVPFDAEHGIYSFFYVEPWSDWVSMPKEMPRTPDQAIAYLKQRAAEGREQDQAVLSSAYEAADGSLAVRIENQPWCDGAVFGVNPSPGVEPGQPGGVTQFQSLMRRIEGAFQRDPQLSGVYHDSFEMYLFHNWRNYRREHFRKAQIPLVFDSNGRVCQYAMFTMVEFAKYVAEQMWSRGKMTFANGTPHAFPWGAAWLDVMGTEAAWASSWGTFGEYQPESDEDFNYWRALCYQRPYLLLLNTRFDLWKPEWFELYMKRSVAYGAFPSMFSHNASEDPYWQNPELYNRDRPLFKKYIPIVCALGAAGWEPVTFARSSDERVYVERFGRAPGPVYLTLLNDSAEPRSAVVSVDVAALGLDADRLDPVDLISGGRPAISRSAGVASFRLELAPQDAAVIELTRG